MPPSPQYRLMKCSVYKTNRNRSVVVQLDYKQRMLLLCSGNAFLSGPGEINEGVLN